MSKIIASALFNLPAQNYVDLEIAQLKSGNQDVSMSSHEKIEQLKQINTRQIQVVLTSVKSIFSAVTPWLFERGHAIQGANELFILSSFCETFQFSNTLTITDVTSCPTVLAPTRAAPARRQSEDNNNKNHSDVTKNNTTADDTQQQRQEHDESCAVLPKILVPNSISKCAKYLKKLFVLRCDPRCFTQELKTQLENANVCFPFLEAIRFANNIEAGLILRDLKSGNGFKWSSDTAHATDIEVYSRIVRSDSLSATSNGKNMKLDAAKMLTRAISTELAPNTIRDVYLTNTQNNSNSNNSFNDITSIIRHAMENQKRDYELWLEYCNVLASLYKPRGVDVEPLLKDEVHFNWLFKMMGEMLHDLTSEFTLLMEKRWPIAQKEIDTLRSGDGDEDSRKGLVDRELLSSIETERRRYERYFQKFGKSFGFISVARRASEFRHDIVVQCQHDIFEQIPILMNLLLRDDFAIDEEEVQKCRDGARGEVDDENEIEELCSVPNEFTEHSDKTVDRFFAILAAFTRDSDDDDDDTNTNSDDEDDDEKPLLVSSSAPSTKKAESLRIIYSLIPISTIVKCLHHGRTEKLHDVTIRYIEGMVFHRYTTAFSILASNEHLLAKKLIFILKHHEYYSTTVVVIAIDLLSKPFESNRSILSEDFLGYRDRLLELGFLETAFKKFMWALKTGEEQNFKTDDGHMTEQPEMTSDAFTELINYCLSADSLSVEYRKAKAQYDSVDASWRMSHWKKHMDMYRWPKHAIENPGKAVLRIRETVPGVVDFLKKLDLVAQRAFIDSAHTPKFSFWVDMVMTEEERAVRREEAGVEDSSEKKPRSRKMRTQMKQGKMLSAMTTTASSASGEANNDNNTEVKANPWGFLNSQTNNVNSSSTTTTNNQNPWSTGGWPTSSCSATATTNTSTSTSEEAKKNDDDGNNKSGFSGWNTSWPSATTTTSKMAEQKKEDDSSKTTTFSSGAWKTSWPKSISTSSPKLPGCCSRTTFQRFEETY